MLNNCYRHNVIANEYYCNPYLSVILQPGTATTSIMIIIIIKLVRTMMTKLHWLHGKRLGHNRILSVSNSFNRVKYGG